MTNIRSIRYEVELLSLIILTDERSWIGLLDAALEYLKVVVVVPILWKKINERTTDHNDGPVKLTPND